MSIVKDNNFNRGIVREMVKVALLENVAEIISSLQTEYGMPNVYDVYSTEKEEESVEALANIITERLETQYSKLEHCAYCGKAININKKYCWFDMTEEYFCNKDCWWNGVENHLDVFEEGEE